VIDHARAGAEAQEQGRLDDAIREFRKVIELQPDSASGHANLGNAYFLKGDYRASIPELEEALKIKPNLLGTQRTLGVVLLVEGDANRALPFLEKTSTPDLLGVAYYRTGRLGSAIVALQAALDVKPTDPDLLYYFGSATALASKRTHDQLIRIKPDFASQSPSPAEPGNSPSADVVSLQKALAGKPDDPELLRAFSSASELASQQAFETLLKSNPGSARAHQVGAEREAAEGHLREARSEYAAALRLNPYTPDVHLAFGNLFGADDNWPAAIAQYRVECELQPENAEPAYRLGFALLKTGDAAGALEQFTAADKLRPEQPRILHVLGQAALAANDPTRAEAAWTMLIRIDKDGQEAAAAHELLAALYRQQGKMKEAERESAVYEQIKKREGH
jgi:tetratricopeptide (TPR) repeat protein